MKKYLIISIALLILGSVASAQYKVNKHNYDYRTYTYQEGDRYNPALAGVGSLLFPGLGQIATGEFTRGTRFIGLVALGGLTAVSGFALAWGESPLGYPLMIIGAAGFVTFWTWSVFDAVRVVKVNNLAYRDAQPTGMNLKLSPSLAMTGANGNGNMAPGISLSITF